MVRASLSLVLLTAACGNAEADPASRAEHKGPVTHEPGPIPGAKAEPEAPREPKTAAKAPPSKKTRASETGPEPLRPAYQQRGSARDGTDDLAFWGWSPDGRLFAFETYFHGAQMAECEGEAELTIVDATTDRYAKDGHVVVKPRDPEAEVCDPPDLREELGYRRDPRLRREAISPALGTGPIPLEGSGENWSFALPTGERVEITFRVSFATEDPMEAADGAAYELRMTLPDGEEVVVERGLRRRRWIMDYDLGQGMVFVGPNDAYVAILVAQTQVIPEGTRTTWMANGARLR